MDNMICYLKLLVPMLENHNFLLAIKNISSSRRYYFSLEMSDCNFSSNESCEAKQNKNTKNPHLLLDTI